MVGTRHRSRTAIAIAEGVAELARQMGGADLSIATAGGLDRTGDEHPIGTDAVADHARRSSRRGPATGCSS